MKDALRLLILSGEYERQQEALCERERAQRKRISRRCSVATLVALALATFLVAMIPCPLRTCVLCGDSARMPGVLYSHRLSPKVKGQDGKWRCKYECVG